MSILYRTILVIVAVIQLSGCGGSGSADVITGTPIGTSSSTGNNNSSSPASTFSVSLTVSGLSSGQSVELLNNATETIVANNNSSYVIASSKTSGTTYSVSVSKQPTNQICVVSNGTGTINGASVNNITVACSSPSSDPVIAVNSIEPLSGIVQLSIGNGFTYQSVTWYSDLKLLGSSTSGAGNPYSWNTSTETNGSHAIIARILISAGTYTEVRRTLSVANSNLTLSAGASGTTGTINVDVVTSSQYGIARVDAVFDGSALSSLTAPNACSSRLGCTTNNIYRFTVDSNVAHSGSHTMVITSIDQQGVQKSVTVAVPISNLPTLTVSSPNDGQFIYGNLNLTGTGLTDKTGGITIKATLGQYEFLNTTNSSFTGTMDLTGLAAGSYTLTVTATDSEGKSTTVTRTLYATSSAALAYSPIATKGSTAQIVTIDESNPSLLLYKGDDSNYRIWNTTSGDEAVLQGAKDLPFLYNWTMDNGYAYVSAGYLGSTTAGYTECPLVCIYQWTPSGVKTNLSNSNPYAATTKVGGGRTYEQYPKAHSGNTIWIDAAGSNAGTFTRYKVSNSSYSVITQPADANYLINTEYDFFVDPNGTVTFFYGAQTGGTGTSSQFDIYRWSSLTNTSTKISSTGYRSVYPKTDGNRVIWQQTATSNTGATSLLAQSVAGGSTTTLSSSASTYQIKDGVAAWIDTVLGTGTGGTTTTTVSALKASTNDGSVYTLSSSSSVSLLATGGGNVVFSESGKVYAWNSTSKIRRLIIDTSPSSTFMNGTTLYFVMGSSKMVYKITVN